MEKVSNKKVLSFNGRNDKSYTKEEAWLATEKIVYDIIHKKESHEKDLQN